MDLIDCGEMGGLKIFGEVCLFGYIQLCSGFIPGSLLRDHLCHQIRTMGSKSNNSMNHLESLKYISKFRFMNLEWGPYTIYNEAILGSDDKVYALHV